MNDVTPAPKPEQPQPITAEPLPEAVTHARSTEPTGLDGIPYEVEDIVGHSDLKAQGDWYVKVLWVGYDAPTWEPASEIPRHLLMPYMRRHRLL